MFSDLNINSKTLKILSLILTVTGIIFILASKYIGTIAIRIAIILVLIFCIVNFKMTYKYLSLKERITYLIAVTAAVIGIFKPELTMLILGVFLLYLTLPLYIKSIKNKDYSDVITLILSGTGILFAVLCILNSKAALQTIVIIIGIAFAILGCICLYQFLITKEDNISHTETENDLLGFEETIDQ